MHIDWWTLALQTVNVLVLLWILSRFFFRPVMDIVARRQAEANKLLSDAAATSAQATTARAAAEKAIADVAADRDRAIAEAHSAAETEKTELLAQSSREVTRLHSEAEATIARDRAASAKAVVAHARELSVDIARRLLGRLPPTVSFVAFLDGLCREVKALPAESRASLAASAGDAIEIVTAAPLSAEDTGRTRDALHQALGAQPAIEFRVDPALIAGLELRSRGIIVRNNWRADLERIGEELGRDERRA